MKALLLSGGTPPSNFLIKKYAESADLIVCADSGVHLLKDVGIHPDILIGDMDSIDKKLYSELEANDVEIIKLNPVKDYSDTHYAIELIKNRGANRLTILGGWGLRIDHSLSNIFSIEHFIGDLKIEIVDDHNIIHLYGEGSYRIDYFEESYLSLFCLSDNCTFSIDNSKYIVRGFENTRDNPIGLSNEMLGDDAKLDVHAGLVLAIQSKD